MSEYRYEFYCGTEKPHDIIKISSENIRTFKARIIQVIMHFLSSDSCTAMVEEKIIPLVNKLNEIEIDVDIESVSGRDKWNAILDEISTEVNLVMVANWREGISHEVDKEKQWPVNMPSINIKVIGGEKDG